jgi:hypothetical protein
MSCLLCDSWAHCPTNPKTLHPRPKKVVEDVDVEIALLTGFALGFGNRSWDDLCLDHQDMVAQMTAKLGGL